MVQTEVPNQLAFTAMSLAYLYGQFLSKSCMFLLVRDILKFLMPRFLPFASMINWSAYPVILEAM